jgi:hypothetical protein
MDVEPRIEGQIQLQNPVFGWHVVRSAAVLLVIPIVFLVTLAAFTEARGPQWMPYTFENPYIYLLASLQIVEGKSPSYIIHPGTTTQVFGAIVLRASSLKPADKLVERTLRNPELQLKKLRAALLIFTTLILWLGPWLTAIFLRNVFVGLLIQAPSLFLRDFWWWGIQFGPELMLVGFSIAASCCCALLAAPSFCPEKLEIMFGVGYRSDSPGTIRLIRLPLLAALTGLICAFGLVTKLIFFPLILISLFCCRTRMNLLSFALAFSFGLAAALIPIYPELPRLATWILNLGIHSGQLGTGPVGLPESSVYLANLSQFLRGEPVLAIIWSVSAISLTLFSFLPQDQPDIRRISWRTTVPVLVIQLVSYLLIAKAPHPRYLIPLSVSLGVNLVLVWYASQNRRWAANRAVALAVLLGLLLLGFADFIERAPSTYSFMRAVTADQLRLYQHALELTKNDVRVDYLFSDSPEFPLCNGNNFADRAFGPLLAKLYPGRLFFNDYTGEFETFTESIKPEVELQSHDHLYFLGSVRLFPKVPGFDPATFKTIDRAGDYYLQEWTRP